MNLRYQITILMLLAFFCCQEQKESENDWILCFDSRSSLGFELLINKGDSIFFRNITDTNPKLKCYFKDGIIILDKKGTTDSAFLFDRSSSLKEIVYGKHHSLKYHQLKNFSTNIDDKNLKKILKGEWILKIDGMKTIKIDFSDNSNPSTKNWIGKGRGFKNFICSVNYTRNNNYLSNEIWTITKHNQNVFLKMSFAHYNYRIFQIKQIKKNKIKAAFYYDGKILNAVFMKNRLL